MKIVIIGTGYVGLVSGVCFAELGMNVTCVDKDINKINRLNNGQIPIYEPDLDKLTASNKLAGRLLFTTDLSCCVPDADAVFIAVGTPNLEGTSQADLRYVFAAAREIAPHLSDYTVVATKSTVPVGTGAKLRNIIKTENPNADFDMASNPEFLREGTAIADFMRPDRVVIGVQNKRALSVMQRLYRPLTLIDTPIVVTSIETAELAKYAANSFLAMKISFINQISDLCDASGANVSDVAKVIGMDQRIGGKFLRTGPGYGGSCFPKDTKALLETAKESGVDLPLVDATIKYNEQRKIAMVNKIINHLGGDVRGKKVAILGLTFKSGTDDMRDAASLTILPALKQHGAELTLYDPKGMVEAKHYLGEEIGQWCNDTWQALQNANAAVILTEWNEFRGLDPEKVRTVMKNPIVIDLRNLYKINDMRQAGILYYSLGRPVASDIVEQTNKN